MSPTALDSRPPSHGSSTLAGPGSPLHAELQRRRRRHRRVVLAVVAGALVVVLGVLVALVEFSPVLATRRVDVRGQRGLSADQVRTAAAVPLGVPLARQDVDAIARRATTIPQVASATVVRSWPRTVTVTVVERRPLLAIAQPDGFALADDQGVVFETRPSVPTGVVQADADPTATALLGRLGVVAAALPPGLRREVERIRATSPDSITLRLRHGVSVTWGDASESPLKAQVVAALLARSTTSIDVSAPHNPAVR